jgi:hypothetical protein
MRSAIALLALCACVRAARPADRQAGLNAGEDAVSDTLLTADFALVSGRAPPARASPPAIS